MQFSPTSYHFIFLRSKYSPQVPVRAVQRVFVTFRNKFNFWRGVYSSTPNPKAGRPNPVDCTRLMFQYIRIYPSYLNAVTSIQNLRTRWTS
jgi:hypothetical protein